MFSRKDPERQTPPGISSHFPVPTPSVSKVCIKQSQGCSSMQIPLVLRQIYKKKQKTTQYGSHLQLFQKVEN